MYLKKTFVNIVVAVFVQRHPIPRAGKLNTFIDVRGFFFCEGEFHKVKTGTILFVVV